MGTNSGVRSGVALHTPISTLLLDPYNPRLPESLRGGEQADLAVVLEMGFDAFAVAQSIADNGYFAAEPLIAIRSGHGRFTIVEGNRRLTALLGLSHPEIRAEFADPGRWSEVADRAGVSPATEVPIVVHENREATHVEVSRAHVVGKLAWRPYMQARFIASRVSEGRSISEVAELIGITKSKAADLYRDQAIVSQAEDAGLSTGEVEKAFSVLTVAMSNTKLRDHIGAPLGSRLSAGAKPVPPGKLGELRELISWVFGDEDSEPVISDSRQMSALGNVVASEVGLGSLRAGKSLEEAKQQVQNAGMNPRERLVKRLTAATNALGAAGDDLAEYAGDVQVVGLLADLEALLESMRNVVDQDPDRVAT
ncbi:ParB/Srx family N-terminal domain-containing protein [Microlunatus antarcticus]|uniref:ParB-like nuclease domain-containing protein n=1 Tax=Microlunatus antarcticus TaxID=53388 RepID=A0A7W5P8P9_9ACTN|nr:ParB/Srx family N-terminal domain-containing protein [Microlunatus antarcticus]MBB3328808.1 hypothetical protein [Microlunatus antarcticus]